MRPLAEHIRKTADAIVACSQCGNMDTTSPCNICNDTKRDHGTICVVEDVADLWAFERGHVYRGLYHVLGGTLSALDGRGPDALSITSLLNRARQDTVQEIIIATNATVDGQTTAHYLSETLKDAGVSITRLAHGIPIGGELDYLDEGTLGAALGARRSMLEHA